MEERGGDSNDVSASTSKWKRAPLRLGNKQNMSPLQAFVGTKNTEVKTVRCARTTRRIRYAPVGPESKVQARCRRRCPGDLRDKPGAKLVLSFQSAAVAGGLCRQKVSSQ